MPEIRAILIDKTDDRYHAELTRIDEATLPEGDVTVGIGHSTLNYKDALALTGKSPVVRRFPMVPGIDFVGEVLESGNPKWQAGDKVVLNGWGCGETRYGGYAEKARIQGDWLVRLPEGMAPTQAMAVGTAGYTAMLCLMALEDHGLTPDRGDVLVTGASGGVGSVAIALLAAQGYRVVAATGRPEQGDYLKGLGAADLIDRSELAEPGKPLARERWAGVIDTVGSHTLANACAGTVYGGTVAACGLAGGMDFPATVAPFILRGVTLAGIDSVMAPLERREEAWRRLAAELDLGKLDAMTTTIGLSAVIAAASDLFAGKLRGRVVVDIGG